LTILYCEYPFSCTFAFHFKLSGMSKISFNRIIPLLTKQEHSDGALGLLREIIVLQAKLDNIDEQDFYFQKGKDNHISHLESMTMKYAEMVANVNNNSVDCLLEQVKEAESKMNEICSRESKHPVFAKVLVQGTSISQIKYFQDLIQLKARFGTLKPLDELMQDETALMEIFS